MPSGPPKTLEVIVRFCLPPACREEVLGDLHERYTGPSQYVTLAMSVIPFVIVSRIRRTQDTLLLLTEALLLYGSFLAAAWYTDRPLLIGQYGLLRLAVPTFLNLAVLMFVDAWAGATRRPGYVPGIAVLAIGFYFSVYGECAGILLIWAVRMVIRREFNRPGRE